MEIFDGRDAWAEAYRQTWFAHFQETGETDWKIYPHPRNATPVSGPGIDLAQSRLILVSTAGGYLPDSQPPFDAPDPLGDYSLRLFSSDTPLTKLAIAHDHYDHTAVDADRQVLIPLRHLESMVEEGKIGSLAKDVISISGYLPDAARLIDELIPQIIDTAREQHAQAALLVPA